MPTTLWAQQQMAAYQKQHAMQQQMTKAQAQMASMQQQAYAQQMAGPPTIYSGLSGTGGASIQNPTWTNLTMASTASTFNFYNTGTNATSLSQVSQYQSDWQRDYDAHLDDRAEALLQHKLHQGRQMLLTWSRHAPPIKFNFIRDNQPVMPMDLRTVEGYRLPEDKLYVLPDGAVLRIDQHGNYGINDESAKVIYQACRRREFNPYLNASDLLVSFIKEVGHLDGVNQDEILRLPVEAFINWLVLQAATKDGDRTDHLPKVEDALKPKALLAAPVQEQAA